MMPPGPRLLADLRMLLRTDTLRRLLASVQRHDLLGIAAEVSYYALFAVFPFLILVAAVVGLVAHDPVTLLARFFIVMHRFLPATTAQVLTQFLEGPLRAQHPGFASFGALAALWAGSQGVAALTKALEQVLCSPFDRSWLRHRALSVVLMLPVLAVSVALLVLMTGDAPDGILSPWLQITPSAAVVWRVLRWPAMFAVIAWVLQSAYSTASCERQRGHRISVGSWLAAAAWILSSAVFARYWDQGGGMSARYAPIGDVMAMMLWLYASVAMILMGAEIDAAITASRSPREQMNPIAGRQP